MNKEKFVLIITLNYNQNNYTLKCIGSILKSKYYNFKILLIDNGSEPNTFKNLKNELPNDKRLILHRINNNRGYVGGINYGLEEGAKLKPDYFLIMNNDTILDPTAISALISACRKYEDKAIVSGKVYHYDDPNRLQYIGSRLINPKTLKYERMGDNEIDKGQYDVIAERDLLDDIFWLIPVELYRKIGGYSRYFWFNGESADYALNAIKNNFKLVYTPHAMLWHKGSLSIGGRSNNPRMVYWQIQSTLIFRYLHLSRINFLIFYIGVIYQIIFTYTKAIIKFTLGRKQNFKTIYASLKGLAYFNSWVFNKKQNTGKEPL